MLGSLVAALSLLAVATPASRAHPLPLHSGALAGLARTHCPGRLDGQPRRANGSEDEAESWLLRLSSDSARERLRAQRWLVAHLTTEDYPSLARAAARGDSELARRLVDALASRERLLGLAVLLASEDEARLRSLGEEALSELLSRWTGGDPGHPLRDVAVAARLAGRPAPQLVARFANEPLTRFVDRLARVAGAQVALVVDPSLAAADSGVTDEPERVLSGSWSELLLAATQQSGVALQGFAFGEQDSPQEPLSPRAWIRIYESSGVSTRDAHEHWIDWMRGVQSSPPGPFGAACAEALAAGGWPAALFWLERRWRELGDENALAGLLLAAGRGRVVPSLADRSLQQELYALADHELSPDRRARGGRERAERIARALRSAGSVGADGGSSCGIALRAWDTLTPEERWVRMVALEDQPCANAREPLRAWIEAEGAAAPVPVYMLQALRTYRGLQAARKEGEPDLRIADLSGLLVWARAAGQWRELHGLLSELGPPPEVLRDPARFELSAAERIDVIGWWLRVGERTFALAHGRELARGADAIAAASFLRDWVRREGTQLVSEFLTDLAAADESGAGEEAATVLRLARLAGCSPKGTAARAIEKIRESSDVTATELLELGGLSVSEEGALARESLLAVLAADEDLAGCQEVLPGLNLAVELMRDRRMHEDLARFEREVARLTWEPTHPFQRAAGGRWPPLRSAPIRALHERDRELP